MIPQVAKIIALTLFAILLGGCLAKRSVEQENVNANINSHTNANRNGNTNANASTRTDWEAMIRIEEQKLRESKIVFNPPAEMKEQKTELIEARISFEDIGEDLRSGLRGSGTVQEEALKVSEIMRVTLTGDGDAFTIQKIGDEEQVVAGKPYAQWEWHVTPLKSGNQKLTLTATATIFLQGRGEKPIYHKSLEKPINVHVDRWHTSKQFVANNWQWLWAVIVAPLVALLWGLLKKGRGQNQ